MIEFNPEVAQAIKGYCDVAKHLACLERQHREALATLEQLVDARQLAMTAHDSAKLVLVNVIREGLGLSPLNRITN